jgi:hypothetical protein
MNQHRIAIEMLLLKCAAKARAYSNKPWGGHHFPQKRCRV